MSTEQKTGLELAELIRSTDPIDKDALDNYDYLFVEACRAVLAARGSEVAAQIELRTLSEAWRRARRIRKAERAQIAQIGAMFQRTEAARVAILLAHGEPKSKVDWEALALELVAALDGVQVKAYDIEPLGGRGRKGTE